MCATARDAIRIRDQLTNGFNPSGLLPSELSPIAPDSTLLYPPLVYDDTGQRVCSDGGAIIPCSARSQDAAVGAGESARVSEDTLPLLNTLLIIFSPFVFLSACYVMLPSLCGGKPRDGEEGGGSRMMVLLASAKAGIASVVSLRLIRALRLRRRVRHAAKRRAQALLALPPLSPSSLSLLSLPVSFSVSLPSVCLSPFSSLCVLIFWCLHSGSTREHSGSTREHTDSSTVREQRARSVRDHFSLDFASRSGGLVTAHELAALPSRATSVTFSRVSPSAMNTRVQLGTSV